VPPKSAAREVVRAQWVFKANGDLCSARAVGRATELTVTVRRGQPVQLVIAHAARQPTPDAPPATVARVPVQLRFAGQAGNWQAAAVMAGEASVASTLPLDDLSLSRIVMLLSGGTLELADPAVQFPIIQLPVSGVEGQTWFNCTRDKLF
jgi:hypothetical protein